MVTSRDDLVFSPQQRERIAGAIAAAEANTSGEIFCVIARKCGDYYWTTLVYGAVLALLAPVLLLAFGLNPLDLAEGFTSIMGGGWSIGVGSSARDEAALGMAIVVGLQTLIFIVVSFLGLNSDIREAMTPRFIKRNHVHRVALEQFLAHGIHLTEGRTGVLIFASLSEHQAEIIADTAIYTKVDPKIWREAIHMLLEGARSRDLAAGLIGAVATSGRVLAEHFPRADNDTDELPNKVVII
jgi:putative membrane protein